MTSPVRLIFLGGVMEIGRNMFVLEYENDMIVVDCGIGFPTPEQPGIDLVLPNFDYVEEHAEKLRGIFLTHGHEDHIGALPYLLRRVTAPVYGTTFTCGLIRNKLADAGLTDDSFVTEFDSDTNIWLEAGVFSLQPFRVTHSIPDCVGFGIQTPAGLFVHTGDYKLDPTPVDGRLTNLDRVREFADRGVRLFISDTTHIEYENWVPSEAVVGEAFEHIFAGANGRIFIATFSSHIARMQQAADVATRFGRKVSFLGRGMVTNSGIAEELGYLDIAEDEIVLPKDAIHVRDEQLCFIMTGSQGEPGSALRRIAAGEDRFIKIEPGDTVVVSAMPIPGNETSVYTMIDDLFRLGANVIYSPRELVHVSGHGSQAEIREMLLTTRAEHLLPFHGEARHLAIFEELAVAEGYASDRVTLADVGDVIEITPEHVEIIGSIPCDPVFVDGTVVGSVEEIVLRDRLSLADDGVVFVVVTIDRATGEVIAGPEVVSRGFVFVRNSGDLIESTRKRVSSILSGFSGNGAVDPGLISRQIRNETAAFLLKETGRRPLVLPVVLQV